MNTPANPAAGPHTPGPWFAHHDREAGPGWDFFITAEPLGHMSDEIAREVSSWANAALIAAAPDLLAALKAHLHEHDQTYDGEGMTIEMARAWEMTRAAIAKATQP